MTDKPADNGPDADDDWCYYLKLTISEDGGATLSTSSRWVGYEDEEGRIEIRKASKVSREKFLRAFSSKSIRYIDKIEDLIDFWENGGEAVVSAWLIEEAMPDILDAHPTTTTGCGPHDFLTISAKAATTKAPSKKLRMQVLERDDYRCRICGQRPSEDPNIILHVHHIKPWADLGATTPTNLVTICHTCHAGLDPHYNFKLAALIDPSE